MFLIRIGAIDGYERLVTDLGGNPVQLLAEVGFSPAQLRDPMPTFPTPGWRNSWS